jgi:hypothetical protein
MNALDSPIAVLEAILDEVEGYRRTDEKSHLPAFLLAAAREITATAPPVIGAGSLSDADDLVGRTIAHVFDGNLIHGDLLIACTDGHFIVLEAESDSCGEDAYVVTRRHIGRSMSYYVRARELRNAGLISAGEYDRILQEEAKKNADAAQQRLATARRAVEMAEMELAKAAAGGVE